MNPKKQNEFMNTLQHSYFLINDNLHVQCTWYLFLRKLSIHINLIIQ